MLRPPGRPDRGPVPDRARRSAGSRSGCVPGLPDLELEPEVVFLVFLPPLLYSAGWYSSPRELKAEVRPLALLVDRARARDDGRRRGRRPRDRARA